LRRNFKLIQFAMKTKLKKSILFIGCISLFSTFSFGQCKNILKKADLSAMIAYEHCENTKVAKMYKGDQASIPQEIKSNKRYRLMTVAQKRFGEVNVYILGENGDTLGIKTKETNQRYWDLMVDKNQQVQIKISVPNESSKTGIDVFGCVAIILGEIENTDLVNLD